MVDKFLVLHRPPDVPVVVRADSIEFFETYTITGSHSGAQTLIGLTSGNVLYVKESQESVLEAMKRK